MTDDHAGRSSQRLARHQRYSAVARRLLHHLNTRLILYIRCLFVDNVLLLLIHSQILTFGEFTVARSMIAHTLSNKKHETTQFQTQKQPKQLQTYTFARPIVSGGDMSRTVVDVRSQIGIVSRQIEIGSRSHEQRHTTFE
jgi:hypothetical protein